MERLRDSQSTPKSTSAHNPADTQNQFIPARQLSPSNNSELEPEGAKAMIPLWYCREWKDEEHKETEGHNGAWPETERNLPGPASEAPPALSSPSGVAESKSVYRLSESEVAVS